MAGVDFAFLLSSTVGKKKEENCEHELKIDDCFNSGDSNGVLKAPVYPGMLPFSRNIAVSRGKNTVIAVTLP